MSVAEYEAEVAEKQALLDKRVRENRPRDRIRSAENSLERAKRKLALARAYEDPDPYSAMGKLAASGEYAFSTPAITEAVRAAAAEPLEFDSPIAVVGALPVVTQYEDPEAWRRANIAEYEVSATADMYRSESQALQERRDKMEAARLREQELYIRTVSPEEELVREIRLERPKATADEVAPLVDPGEAAARKQAQDEMWVEMESWAGKNLLEEPVIVPVAGAEGKINGAFRTLLFLGFVASALGAVGKRRK